MVNTNQDALGIIFPNSYDNQVPELVSERLMASIPFASRYRMIDFILSSMVNCGIDNVSVIVRKNYRSLMRHLGSGREWDLTRKNGGLNIVPPFAEKTVKVYNGRVEALASILEFLKLQREKYVIISDANIVANFDFNAMIDAHINNGADVTIAYKKEVIPDSFMNLQPTLTSDLYYTLQLDSQSSRVTQIKTNPKDFGPQNYSMNMYLIDRELLIEQIAAAYAHGFSYFERDILAPQLGTLAVCGYEYTGYTARISDKNSYFYENMRLLQDENLSALFDRSPIYTRVRDDNPTRYIGKSKVKNSMLADGCVIEGEVENCVLFRGVKVGRGSVVKNCILMQDTTIMDNVDMEYIITDKEVTVSSGKELKGNDNFPIFVPAYKEI
ncbi:MAG: glucose-1-phosphate adenylyltransferase subunit GlgD [bacterium]|nr:glucose-1-phosphate adenylyltransferase subunit GlgD [bacterium]MCM1375267.1 glucose-1-phosphate adenylyltransferase subunit GlgD [Muribaculum sp.]MCM1409817.1 glucose-1-phosphate adenylyltransferase subunit GlgD [Lachnospiraceae bacterium]